MSTAKSKLKDFPYRPLGETAWHVQAIFEAKTKVEYTRKEIGPYIGITNENTLGDRIRSMKSYGFMENSKPGSVVITPLAKSLTNVEEGSKEGVYREAFFNIPLFGHLHEKFGLFALDSALRNELTECGIKPRSEATRAIRVFKQSAEFAGLWDESASDELTLIDPMKQSSSPTEDLEMLMTLFDTESAQWSVRKHDLWKRIVIRCFKRLPNDI